VLVVSEQQKPSEVLLAQTVDVFRREHGSVPGYHAVLCVPNLGSHPVQAIRGLVANLSQRPPQHLNHFLARHRQLPFVA